jgi:hypothetical protein
MAATIIRPLPVSGEVAIRSTLLALANAGAELQTYNEEARTIVARVPKWFGLKKSTIMVRVQDYGDNCRLELQLPDVSRADEVLHQIGLYLVDGHRVASDITMRWAERQQGSGPLQAAGRRVIDAVRRPTRGAEAVSDPALLGSGDEAQLAVVDPSAPLATSSHNFITVHEKSRQVQINVDSELFADRSSYLESCPACAAVVLRGSQFCPSCGRPVSLESVSAEVDQGSKNAARSSLIFGGLGLGLNLIPLLLLFFPMLGYWISNLGGGEAGVAPGLPLTPVRILLSLVLGVAPSLVLGNEARRMAKTADLYLGFRFNKRLAGKSRASLGRILGWLAIYLSVGWIVFLAAIFLL